MSSIAVAEAPVGGQHGVEHSGKSGGDRASQQRAVDARERLGRIAGRSLRNEMGLSRSSQQRRRRPLPGDIAEREREGAVADFKVIVEIATNRTTGETRRGQVAEAPRVRRFGKERPLNVGGHAEIAIDPPFLGLFGVETRALDGQSRLCRKRLER